MAGFSAAGAGTACARGTAAHERHSICTLNKNTTYKTTLPQIKAPISTAEATPALNRIPLYEGITYDENVRKNYPDFSLFNRTSPLE